MVCSALFWEESEIQLFGFMKQICTKHLSHLMTKLTKWYVRSAKTQISLGIRPVWSESSPSAWRKLGSLATHWAHSKDSDQNGWLPRLIRVFAGRTVILLVLFSFVMRRLIYAIKLLSIYVFSYFPFGFEGRMWDLIASVPDHCLSFNFSSDMRLLLLMCWFKIIIKFFQIFTITHILLLARTSKSGMELRIVILIFSPTKLI